MSKHKKWDYWGKEPVSRYKPGLKKKKSTKGEKKKDKNTHIADERDPLYGVSRIATEIWCGWTILTRDIAKEKLKEQTGRSKTFHHYAEVESSLCREHMGPL